MPRAEEKLLSGSEVVQVGNDGSICACFDDIGICCCGMFCTTCLAGDSHKKAGIDDKCLVPINFGIGAVANAVLVSTGHPYPVGIVPIVYGWYLLVQRRAMIQQKFDGEEDGCFSNLCLYCFCAPCAICQVRVTVLSTPITTASGLLYRTSGSRGVAMRVTWTCLLAMATL